MRAPDRGERRIVAFTRYPQPGQAKTRLIPALGADGAAGFHRDLTEHALRRMRSVEHVSLEVRYTGADEATMRGWLGDAVLRAQCDGDLGARVADAFAHAFAGGARSVIVAGTDCPDLGPETFEAAFDALSKHDVVLGPAVDGGYYLIGLRATAWPRAAAIFKGVAWSTEQVMSQTRDRIARAGLSHSLTAPLADIDVPEDLVLWDRFADSASAPSLTVVVPTFNAGDGLVATLRSVRAADGIELIVADAQSTDATRETAREFGARVVEAPRGRARQMNFASAFASADTLLFLHSDTTLPARYLQEIDVILQQPDIVLGAFRFATDFVSPAMRIVEATTNLRARWLQLPYGDQGLFVRTKDFRRLGGFREMPLMDDFDFVRRARKLGRVGIARSAAVTSGERWRELGVWRTMWRNQTVIAMYACGVAPETLAGYYRRGAKR